MVAAFSAALRAWLVGQRAHVLLAVLAASAALPQGMHGAPLESNPITPLDDRAPLTHEHPAFGAAIDERKKIEPLVFDEPYETFASGTIGNATLDRHRGEGERARRFLEASYRDIQRLEDYFGESLERNFYVLKDDYSSGVASSIPWPSSYWPTFEDGINFAWRDDEPAPSEKLAVAFKKDVKQLQDTVSRSTGILGQSKRKHCNHDSGCKSLDDGSKCGIRSGERSGFCIPTWYGICHAWAAAAIMEPEPKCNVEKNGVLFRPYDIKALMSQVYDGAEINVVFTGARFDGPDYPANKDKYGRYKNPSRLDVGPGFFHLSVANILGKHKKSFIVDVASDSEVWNQPLRSYKVLQMELVDIKDASLQYFGTDYYPFNKDAKYLAYTELALSWIDESDEDGELIATGRVDKSTTTRVYKYFLEMDAAHKIIGGEWLHNSRYNHPDFLWFPTEKPAPDAMVLEGISYREISELLELSQKCVPTTSAPTPSRDVTPATARPTPGTNEPATPPHSSPSTPTSTSSTPAHSPRSSPPSVTSAPRPSTQDTKPLCSQPGP